MVKTSWKRLASWVIYALLALAGCQRSELTDPIREVEHVQQVPDAEAVIGQMNSLIEQSKFSEAHDLGSSYPAAHVEIAAMTDSIKSKARIQELELLLKMSPADQPEVAANIYEELAQLLPESEEYRRTAERYRRAAEAKSAADERLVLAGEKKREREVAKSQVSDREKWLMDACHLTCAAHYHPVRLVGAYEVCMKGCLREALK